MGVAERKERQRQELRGQILAAARRIVAAEGFAGLTMRKIADAIEYSPATIYLYFENREAIGRQLCLESFEHLVAYMQPVTALPEPRERLLAIGRAYTRFGRENPEEYKLLFMTDDAYMRAIFGDQAKGPNDPGERAFQFVADTVRACAECGAIAADDPLLVAEMLWASAHGIVSLVLTCREVIESDVDRLIETLLTTLISGLAVRATPSTGIAAF